MSKEQAEQLQYDIMIHCNDLPFELVDRMCQVIIDYYNEHKEE